jgi:hypothetical protein
MKTNTYQSECAKLDAESRAAGRIVLSWSIRDKRGRVVGRTNGVRSVWK